jgi:hypothetical protein
MVRRCLSYVTILVRAYYFLLITFRPNSGSLSLLRPHDRHSTELQPLHENFFLDLEGEIVVL